MFSCSIEITKTCKKIKGAIEIIYPKRQAHIMPEKVQVFGFKFQCFFDAIFTKVNACYIKALFCKKYGMSSFSTRNVQQVCRNIQVQVINQLIDEGSRFCLIPVKVKLMI